MTNEHYQITVDADEAPDTDTLRSLQELLERWREIDKRERELKQEKERLKEEAKPLMRMCQVRKAEAQDVGRLTLKEGTNVSLNRKSLYSVLLEEHGFTADVAENTLEAATKRTKYETVEFKPAKD